jgi:hypothetical protein
VGLEAHVRVEVSGQSHAARARSVAEAAAGPSQPPLSTPDSRLLPNPLADGRGAPRERNVSALVQDLDRCGALELVGVISDLDRLDDPVGSGPRPGRVEQEGVGRGGMGNSPEALRLLEAGYEQRDVRMVFLGIDPKWDSLRTDPRFVSLLRRMKLGG